MTIWLSAGEPSGDRWGALLAAALVRRDPGLHIVGMGGEHMRAAGVDAFDPPGGGIAGFAEPIRRFGAIVACYRRASRVLEREHPGLVVTIDFPDFHVRLLGRAKALRIPAVWVIPPQVWAWRPARARHIAALCRTVVTAFDWEREWYTPWMPEKDVHWCGHPLADTLVEVAPSQRAGGTHALALLPGSRRTEIVRLAPLMAEAARRLRLPAVFAADRQETASWMRDALGAQSDRAFPVVVGQTIDVLRTARAALVCAGTATLEAASLGVPTVVVYRTDWLTYRVAWRLVRIPWIGLPNIILGRPEYPELVQDGLTAESLIERVAQVLDEPWERWQRLGEEIRTHLGEPGVFDRMASVVLSGEFEA